mmetsp:Transcript_32192/g.96723  ORF Transcript_32192/g.96723 Transcript_32192/m.96723 type:complete len:424 (-) Transcript_32192:166-1437(-)
MTTALEAKIARRIDPIFDKVEQDFNPRRHVHVGAGKLGLALVVPSLQAARDATGQTFRVIDTPKDPNWAPLLASEGDFTVTLEVNGDRVCVLKLATTPAAVASAGDAPCLVVSDDEATLAAAVAGATTLSCSLGPWMAQTMTRLVGLCDAAAPTLYACENDHKAVASLNEALRVTVVDCMVDRVSTARAVDADAAMVRVTAEAWGGTIVSLDPAANKMRAPPFGDGRGAAILAPTTEAAAEYLSARKLALVNGTHTTLAFLSLRARHALEPGTIPLMKPSQSDPDELRAWSLARAAALIHDHGLATVKAASGLAADAADEDAFATLTKYAAEAQQRFEGPDDTVARVLSWGVAARWHGRLESVVEGLDRARDHDPAVAKFLDRAAAPPDLRDKLVELVEATRGAHDRDCELHEARGEPCCHHE